MEDQSTKITNLQLKISEHCPEEYKQIIEDYWELDKDFKFVNLSGVVKNKYALTQHQLIKLIKEHSVLSFYKFCKTCNSFELQEVFSQSTCRNNLSVLESSYYAFKCANCYAVFQAKREKKLTFEREIIEQQQEEKRLELLKKLNTAINNKVWKRLSNFEKQVLKDSIHFNNFKALKKYYWDTLGSLKFGKLFSALRNIASANLLVLDTDVWDEKRIEDYKFLDRLAKEDIVVDSIEKDNVSEVEYDKETNQIKFKLTINDNQNHPDSPLYAGTVKFNERIIIEPGVEYVFGQWQRAYDNLYLTMIPLDNLEKTPTQKRISSLPISLQKGVADFLNNLGRNIDVE